VSSKSYPEPKDAINSKDNVEGKSIYAIRAKHFFYEETHARSSGKLINVANGKTSYELKNWVTSSVKFIIPAQSNITSQIIIFEDDTTVKITSKVVKLV